MSMNKQKNFLFLLFLLINKFIFISGNIVSKNNETSNETIIGIGDFLDHLDNDSPNENYQVSDSIKESYQVSDSINESDKVSDTTNEIFQVSDSTNESDKISESTNESDKTSDSTNESDKVSESTNESDKISESTNESDKTSDSTNESDKVSDKTKDSDKVSDTTKESDKASDTTKESDKASDTTKESDKASDTNNEGNIDIKLENYQSCEDIQPTNGIIEDCTSYSYNNDQSCCYVSINYKYNEFNICIKIKKDKKIIESRIEQLEKYYEGSDSVDIDCHSKFINFNLILLLFVLFL